MIITDNIWQSWWWWWWWWWWFWCFTLLYPLPLVPTNEHGLRRWLRFSMVPVESGPSVEKGHMTWPASTARGAKGVIFTLDITQRFMAIVCCISGEKMWLLQAYMSNQKFNDAATIGSRATPRVLIAVGWLILEHRSFLCFLMILLRSTHCCWFKTGDVYNLIDIRGLVLWSLLLMKPEDEKWDEEKLDDESGKSCASETTEKLAWLHRHFRLSW